MPPAPTEIVTIAAGETPEPLVVEVTDAETGDPIDLNGVEHVRFRMVSDATGVVFDKRGSINDPNTGRVEYEWGRTDLQIPARHYDAAFLLRFDDRRQIVAPSDGRLVLRIVDSPFSP